MQICIYLSAFTGRWKRMNQTEFCDPSSYYHIQRISKMMPSRLGPYCPYPEDDDSRDSDGYHEGVGKAGVVTAPVLIW
jgi:hypothetical protein